MKIEEPKIFPDDSNGYSKLLLPLATPSEERKFKFGQSKSYKIPFVVGDSGFARTEHHDDEHISLLAGIRIIVTGKSPNKFSGYQVMRLATELMPTFASILGITYSFV
jgi:hypothetical protein